ncbi:hypothetical protein VaNZ11_012494 [Volvox africanus]|uniref:Uncharacterized protein n=1 Tax=Volvox africanus TaxID=51714 RepID=A0ABQ5SES3_9CHLO|nr:hypothetical protein VaNZ11_012494 [Volvox africanus]
MPHALQPSPGEGLALDPLAGSGPASHFNLVTSCAPPLVFGSRLPEDLNILGSEISESSTMPAVSDPSGASVSALGTEAVLSCNAPYGDTDMPECCTYTPQQHTPVCASVLSALHLLMGANFGPPLQQQLFPIPGQPVFLVPEALPVLSSQLIQFLGGIPGLAAPSPIPSMPAWGMLHGIGSPTQFPYQGPAYVGSTGFWLHGMYFPSYEHYIAYRRRTIAYNFHFFGIRPYFRPPRGLPRPRPPTSGAKSSVDASAHSAVAGGALPPASSGYDTLIPGSHAGKACEDASASPCGSPGSSSTCSNGDSDDIGSDISHVDPDTDVACGMQKVAARLNCRHLSGSRLKAAAEAGCPGQRCGHQTQNGTTIPAAGSLSPAVIDSSCACASNVEQRLMSSCAGCAPVTLPCALSPIRCFNSAHSNNSVVNSPRDEVLEDVRLANMFGPAWSSAVAGICPQWLELHFRVLVEKVVGDAILSVEDAA